MKRVKLSLVTLVLALLMCMPAYAGQWIKDDTGWWYQNNDGTYLKNGWYWIDGASYLFNDNGYIYQSTTTSDGYQVDGNGAWVENGIVKTRSTEASISNISVSVPNGYDVEIDIANSSIAVTEVNGVGGALLMNVNEPAIVDIRGHYGEDGLKRVSDEVVGGLITEVGNSPVLLAQDIKQYPNGFWYHYTYNVYNSNNEEMKCNMYINFLEQDARIVIIVNNNREFTEDQFMMYFVK